MKFSRWWSSTLLAAVGLAGCGFHPRDEVRLPAALHQVVVEDVDAYSQLARNLREALTRAGATVRKEAGEGTARIRLTVDQPVTEPLSIGATARVQEYVVRYKVELEVLDAAAKPLLEKTPIELSREYSFDANQALGAASEEELIKKELLSEMTQQVLRRIEAIK